MPLKRPIIVEGPDGAGKSSLLRRLSASTGLPVYHTGGPPLDAGHLQQKIWGLHEHRSTHLIDRCPHISDPIYSRVNDRRLFLPLSQLQRDLLDIKPLIIYCRLASVREMFQSIDRSDKPHKPAEHLREVADKYAQVVLDYDEVFKGLSASRSVKVVRYDWTENPYQSILNEVLECVV